MAVLVRAGMQVTFLALMLFFEVRLGALEFSMATNAGRRATVIRVDPKVDALKLFLRDDRGNPLKSFKAVERLLQARGQRLLFAMNGGMYQPDLSPVGLCVVDASQLAPLNVANGEGNFFLKPNGVFLVTSNGALVIESSKYAARPDTVLLATQSGPLLVESGVIHSRLNPNSTSRLIRNGVGVRVSGEVVFAMTEEPINFHEFATLFRDQLKCTDALYLDGVISSLHAPPLKRSDVKTDLGPIIAVVE
jgi:uncharacterized protein YigE (DUF2233 family)